MSFANKEFLFFFVVLIPFIIIAVLNYKKKQWLLSQFLSPKARQKMEVRSSKEIDFFRTGLITFACIFLMMALAGPQWGEKIENVDIKGIELLFLLDTSHSMRAEDLRPSRFDLAKQMINEIVDQLDMDMVGLVNFAGYAYIQCPLTVDYEAFKLLVDASIISPDEEQGTDFAQAFNVALRSFRSASKDKKVIIMITDGEDWERNWESFIPRLRKDNIYVFTIGVGAISGAPIPMIDKNNQISDWKKDKTGNIIKTTLNESVLIKIATDTEAQYSRLNSVSAIDMFIKNLKKFEREKLRSQVQTKKIDRFQIPLVLGMILLIIELFLTEKRILWKRKS